MIEWVLETLCWQAIKDFFGKWFTHKDPELIEAEHALAAKQRETEILAAPIPSDAVLDKLVREHQPK